MHVHVVIINHEGFPLIKFMIPAVSVSSYFILPAGVLRFQVGILLIRALLQSGCRAVVHIDRHTVLTLAHLHRTNSFKDLSNP